MRFLVASVSSSTPPPSPFALAPVVPRRDHLGAGEDLRRLVQLGARQGEALGLLQLRPRTLPALGPGPSYRLVGVGYHFRYLPGPDVPLADPAVFALGLVVVEVAAAPLPGHPLRLPPCATFRQHPRLCDKRCNEASVLVAGESFPVGSGVAAHHGAGRLARLGRPVYGLPPGPASQWSGFTSWVSVRFLVSGRSYRSVVDQLLKPPTRGSLRGGISRPRLETTAPRPTRPSAGRIARPLGIL